MATLTIASTPQPVAAPGLPALRAALAALAAWRARRGIARRGRDEMAAMSPGELTDLGIGRSEIPYWTR